MLLFFVVPAVILAVTGSTRDFTLNPLSAGFEYTTWLLNSALSPQTLWLKTYPSPGVVDWAGIDCQYNALNQLVAKVECRREDLTFVYEYDGRGNLVLETKAGKTEAAYVYDGTNRLAKGMNGYGETSEYVYDGLGNLVGQAQNVMQGYYGFNRHYFPEAENDPMGAQHGAWSASGKQLVAKSFVIDYASGLKNILVETDVKADGFGVQSRKYVYGLQKASAAISQESPGLDSELTAKPDLHHDRLGSVGFATDAATGAVLSRSGYDTWGREAMAEELSVDGESWAFTEYTVHTYDPVLGLYYAKARMYDADNRRFVSADPAWSLQNIVTTGTKAAGEI
jgi:RHS repeat-associated protein